MKLRNLFITLGLALATSAGIIVGLTANGNTKEAQAAASTYFEKGTVLYIDDSSSKWSSDNAKIGIWNHAKVGGTSKGTNCVNVATYDSVSKKYKVTISVATDAFNLVRASSLTEGSTSFPDKWNQSDNVYASSGKNMIIGTGYSDGKMTSSWGTYDPENYSTGTFYMRTPKADSNNTYTINVYTYEEIIIDGFNIGEKKLMGDWPGTKLTTYTSKTYYNPANITSEHGGYGILKVDFKYSNLNNVGVIVNVSAKPTSGDTWSFQTKDMKVGASGTNQLELKVGAYYYSYQSGSIYGDSNLWDNFGYDSTKYAEMGSDAAVAYDLDRLDLCTLTKTQADELRTRMLAKGNYLGYATQTDSNGTYYYDDIYRQVNSKCTNPYALSNTSIFGSVDSTTAMPIILAVSAVTLLTIPAYFYFKQSRKIKE